MRQAETWNRSWSYVEAVDEQYEYAQQEAEDCVVLSRYYNSIYPP